MTTVRRLLQTKGNDIWAAAPNDTILSALQLMAEKNVGALVVRDGPDLVGIVSERDYARKAAVQTNVDPSIPVSSFMTCPVITVDINQTIEDCMSVMTEKHIRHLPVVDGGRLTGMISIGDVVKEMLSDREFTIQHLENYITGKK